MQTTKTDRWTHSIPAAAPTLRLLYSGGRLSDVPAQVLRPGTTAIGRYLSANEGLGLPANEKASRLHARLQVSDPSGEGLWSVMLNDANSKNGTFVNGYRITGCTLKDGDVVRMGDSLLLLRYEPACQVDGPVQDLLGISPCLRALRSQLAQVAPTGAPVLLIGETGTGKELAAQALHRLSQIGGRKGPLIALNAAAIPETLAESQLFGHVAGAFSDARTSHDGFFRAAHGGTLFLDEIGELSLPLQAKLLRVLEEKAVTPVGATRPIACDVRLVAATHRNLKDAVEAKDFRGDLYSRLSALPIELPPLRARCEDVLLLLAHHWGAGVSRMTTRLAEALLLYQWPYNVRELVNLTVYLKMHAVQTQVLDLPLVASRLGILLDAKLPTAALPFAPAQPTQSHDLVKSPLPPAPRQPPIAREVLIRMMTEQQGIIARVAELAGRSRRQVRRWLAYYRIEHPGAET